MSTKAKGTVCQSEPLVKINKHTKQPDQQNPNQGWCGFSWRKHPITQAPIYPDTYELEIAEQKLQNSKPIVSFEEVQTLIDRMAEVALYDGFILQVGDCAETFLHSDVSYTTQRISFFYELARLLSQTSKGPVITMGRMAGQFAKPRSALTEIINGEEVSSYFGDVVNNIAPNSRTPDPKRLIIGYQVALDTVSVSRVFSHLWSATTDSVEFKFGDDFFVCHEAYLLPYEQNLLRSNLEVFSKKFTIEDFLMSPYSEPPSSLMGTSHEATYLATQDTTHDQIQEYMTQDAIVYASSAHFLWIGDRTREINSAHIEFAKHIINPVGVKVGPTCKPEELISLVKKLNPHKIPGRLSFIFRLGINNMHQLTGYIQALKNANLEKDVLWICDPMHGNTTKTDKGIKTRKIENILYEINAFFQILFEYRIIPSGLHLEITPQNCHECLNIQEKEDSLKCENYLSTCDPRLNVDQAMYVVQKVAHLLNQFHTALCEERDTF